MCFAMFTFGAGTGGHGRSGRIKKNSFSTEAKLFKNPDTYEKKNRKKWVGMMEVGVVVRPPPITYKVSRPKAEVPSVPGSLYSGTPPEIKKKAAFHIYHS